MDFPLRTLFYVTSISHQHYQSSKSPQNPIIPKPSSHGVVTSLSRCGQKQIRLIGFVLLLEFEDCLDLLVFLSWVRFQKRNSSLGSLVQSTGSSKENHQEIKGMFFDLLCPTSFIDCWVWSVVSSLLDQNWCLCCPCSWVWQGSKPISMFFLDYESKSGDWKCFLHALDLTNSF